MADWWRYSETEESKRAEDAELFGRRFQRLNRVATPTAEPPAATTPPASAPSASPVAPPPMPKWRVPKPNGTVTPGGQPTAPPPMPAWRVPRGEGVENSKSRQTTNTENEFSTPSPVAPPPMPEWRVPRPASASPPPPRVSDSAPVGPDVDTTSLTDLGRPMVQPAVQTPGNAILPSQVQAQRQKRQPVSSPANRTSRGADFPTRQPSGSVNVSASPDGRVAAKTDYPDEESRRLAYVQKMWPLALQYSQETGIPPEVYLAFGASEGNWGNAAGFNLFGVKAHGGTDSQAQWTEEDWDGDGYSEWHGYQDFARYPSADAAYRDKTDLITSGRYADAYARFKQTGDWKRWLQDINAAGYATNPSWGGAYMQSVVGQVNAYLDKAGIDRSTTTPGGIPESVVADTSMLDDDPNATPMARQINTVAAALNQGAMENYDSESDFWKWRAAACSAASLAYFLNRYTGQGLNISDTLKMIEDSGAGTDISPGVGLTNVRGAGVSLADAATQSGINAQARAIGRNDLVAMLQSGQPVMLQGSNWGPGGHWFVATGLKPDGSGITVADSGYGRTELSWQELQSYWSGVGVYADSAPAPGMQSPDAQERAQSASEPEVPAVVPPVQPYQYEPVTPVVPPARDDWRTRPGVTPAPESTSIWTRAARGAEPSLTDLSRPAEVVDLPESVRGRSEAAMTAPVAPLPSPADVVQAVRRAARLDELMKGMANPFPNLEAKAQANREQRYFGGAPGLTDLGNPNYPSAAEQNLANLMTSPQSSDEGPTKLFGDLVVSLENAGRQALGREVLTPEEEKNARSMASTALYTSPIGEADIRTLSQQVIQKFGRQGAVPILKMLERNEVTPEQVQLLLKARSAQEAISTIRPSTAESAGRAVPDVASPPRAPVPATRTILEPEPAPPPRQAPVREEPRPVIQSEPRPSLAQADAPSPAAPAPQRAAVAAEQVPVVAPDVVPPVANAGTPVGPGLMARQPARVSPAAIPQVAGTLGGGYAGYESAPEDASTAEVIARTLGGALLVAGAVGLAGRAFRRPAPLPRTGIRELDEIRAMWESQRPGSWVQRMAAEIGDLPARLETRLLDEYARVNKATTEARKAMGVRDRMQTPDAIDAEAYWSIFRGRAEAGAQWAEDGLKPVYRLLENEDEVLDFESMVKLLRDVEVGNLRTSRGATGLRFSGGVQSVADAQNRLALLEQKVGPQVWARFQQADAALKAHLDSILDAKIKAGIIDQQFADDLRRVHPHYSPQLVANLDNATATLGGKSLRVDANGIRRLSETGHDAADVRPLSAAILVTMRENNRIMRNEAVDRLLAALRAIPRYQTQIRQVPNVKLTTGALTAIQGQAAPAAGTIGTVATHRMPDIPGTIHVWRNGKLEYWTVPPEFEKLVKPLATDPELLTGYSKIANVLNSLSRSLITTRNPIFPVVNGQADLITALASGLNPAQIARGYADSFGATNAILKAKGLPVDDIAARFRRAGGGQASWYGQGAEATEKLSARMERELRQAGGFPIRSVGDIPKAVFDVATLKPVETFGTAVEMAPRLAAFRRATELGANPARAAMEGRRVTLDFGRAGTTIRRMNAVTLFLNASIQGTAQLGRLARDSSTARFLAAGLAATALGTYAWNRQFIRPDGTSYYSNIPSYIRDTNMILLIPGTEYQDETGEWKMRFANWPLRQFGIFTAPVLYAAAQMDNNDPREVDQFLGEMFGRTLSPVQGEGAAGLLGSLMPAGVSTAMQLGTNTDLYRGFPIRDPYLMSLNQPEREFSERTTKSARDIAGYANNVKDVPILGSLTEPFRSPQAVDFIAGDIGSVGTQAMAVSDLLQGAPNAGRRVEDATIGRLLRNKGGQVEQTRGEAYRAELQRRYDEDVKALKQSPRWQNATEEQRNRMLRELQRLNQAQLVGELGDQAPKYAQKQVRDGPPRWEPREIPVSVRQSYREDPYGFEEQVRDAVAHMRAYNAAKRQGRNVRKPPKIVEELAALGNSQKRVSSRYRAWADANAAEAERQTAELQGLVNAP